MTFYERIENQGTQTLAVWIFIELLARMCNVLRLGSEVCNWLPASYLEKKEYSLHSAFCTQPAFYFQSAVCILHSLCILPLVRSLQSAVRSLVGASYMIIIMYLNILIISYYMLLLLYYKHLQISSYIPIHHCTPLYIAIYPYTTPYTPIQQHILLYITIHPHTSPYTAIHHHTPPYITIHPHTSPYTAIHHHTPHT